MAKQQPAGKTSTRSIRLPEEGLAIICNSEQQMLFISGFTDKDPGGQVIWSTEKPSTMSMKLDTATARELFLRRTFAEPRPPKGSCYIRVEQKDAFLIGYIGDVEVLRIPTKSQVSKTSAASARAIATACGMSEQEMAPMFAYPQPAQPATEQ